MRLLVVCGGSYVSGMEIAALSVMEGLQERGHDVHCVANAWNDGDFPHRLRTAGIPYDELSLGKISASLTPKHVWWSVNGLVHLPYARYRYRNVVDHFDPDLILFYGFDTAAQLYPINQSIPTAFHVQELPEGSWKLSFVLETHPSALYIAISEFIADRLRALGVSRQQIEVVHNGIDVESLARNGDMNHAEPQQEAEGNDGFHVGIVGQVGDWKGHEDLVEALAFLKRQEPALDVTLHVAGTGKEGFTQELKKRADRLGVAEQVRWHGFVDDIGDIYALLDVVVVPSRHEEPFGLVAAEAGLWQCPVVATRRGGLPEVVAHEETGFLVDSRSPDQIAARLRQLADNPELRDRMGKEGEKRVEARFSVQDMVEGVHDAIIGYSQ